MSPSNILIWRNPAKPEALSSGELLSTLTRNHSTAHKDWLLAALVNLLPPKTQRDVLDCYFNTWKEQTDASLENTPS